jgi:VWFA-related protein
MHVMQRAAAVVAALLGGAGGTAEAQIRVDERVDVARVLVDVRVTDGRGAAIRGLAAEDFRVEIDGEPARLEWVRWIGESVEAATGRTDPSGPPVADAPAGAGAGRLVLFLFQKELMKSRVEGFVRMMRDSARFVDRLGPRDRAAVLVYDSRLRLWLDFTTDRERLRRTLAGGILSEPPSIDAGEGISLGPRLAARPASDAYTPEDALRVVAESLRDVGGAKSLVLFGHGFGAFRAHSDSDPLAGGRAVLDERYDRARDALVAARVSVFALDVTQATSHTLESALMTVAEETGGFYARTFEFPAQAMQRLDGALTGYYVLSVERPGRRTGRHRIEVRARPPGASVLARRFYVD